MPLPKKPRRYNAKAGWRKIGNQRCYFRSKMEANYAGVLELLRKTGQIVYWKHECRTFYFPVKRGCVSYLPDFEIVTKGGNMEYRETKGYMCKKSIIKLKRMAIHYPDVTVVVIGVKEMAGYKKTCAHLIPTWED